MHARAIAAALLGILMAAPVSGQEKQTWGERLGYPGDKRVVMFHADDIGMCHEANQSAKKYLKAGEIQSAAAMVPCPWFDEFAAWYKAHPKHDVGLHLTLTSEWRHYRWPAVLPKAEVPGLFDKSGYLPHTVLEVAMKAKPGEVEAEVRAQVKRALARGIKPTHLDTHMGTLFATPAFAMAYMKVALEFDIPAMVIELTPKRVAQFRKQGYPLTPALLEAVAKYPGPKLDNFLSLQKAESFEALREQLFKMVRNLEPGITEIIFHPSAKTKGLKAITNSWQQRVWEGKLFSNPQVKRFLQEEGVLFTSWREMKQRHDKAKDSPKAAPAPKLYK